MNLSCTGILYIVPTPIGNLLDFTYRGVKVLQDVDMIAAENIQHTNILLKYFHIKNYIIVINKNNENKQSHKLLKKLKEGKNIALVSNAGTPLINDPGYTLVKQCYLYNIKITPLPGACAAITALSASGISTNRFCYEGFLPAKKKMRCNLLRSLKEETRTIIFYESKHRILESIQDIIQEIGDQRPIVLAREITKKWESIHSTTTGLMFEWLKEEKNRYQGEMVLIIDGFKKLKNISISQQTLNTLHILQDCLSLKQAIYITSKIHHIRKNTLYQYSIKKEK